MIEELKVLNQKFDKIFVLTLEGQHQRQNHMRQALQGVDFEFFYGVDKENFTLEEAERSNAYSGEVARTRVRSGKEMPKGMLACSWSHKNIYKKIIEDKLENALIFEDDLQPLDSSLRYLNVALSELPKDWELFYLGYWKNDQYELKERFRKYFYLLFNLLGLSKWSKKRIKNMYAKPYSNYLRIAGNHETTHAYAISRSCAKKLFDLQSPISYHPDHLLSEAITSELIKAYLVKPMMFWQLSLEDNEGFKNLTT